jgi:uncharacterized membrane protein YeiB
MFYIHSGGGFGGYAPTISLYGVGVQTFAQTVLDVLVRHKSRLMFGLLMGVGIAVQIERAEGRGKDILPILLRRLSFLYVLGFLLSLFVAVDQLLTLAVSGLVAFFIAYPLRQRRWLLLAVLLWLHFGTLVQEVQPARR